MNSKRIFAGLLPVMIFIILWERIAQLNLVPNYIFPAFSDVMIEFYPGMAWRVVIAAEMVAIPTGIGALMMRSESLLRMDVIIVCPKVLSVMCLAFERFFQVMETRITNGRR